MNSIPPISGQPHADATRHAVPTRDNIAQLVATFYGQIRRDPLLGPVFAQALDGRWDSHLPKMVDFWSSLVLGEKAYQGNLKATHQALSGITPGHFERWLALFLDTVDQLYQPAAAAQFMEPALRIAHSLQLSQFGWQFKIPAAQRAALERLRPRRDETPHTA